VRGRARRLPPKSDKICRRDINFRIEFPNKACTRRIVLAAWATHSPAVVRELNSRLLTDRGNNWFLAGFGRRTIAGSRSFHLPPSLALPFCLLSLSLSLSLLLFLLFVALEEVARCRRVAVKKDRSNVQVIVWYHKLGL